MATKEEKKELGLQDALIAIQKKLKAPKDLYNKFGNYKYRSAESILEAVKPLLAENGVLMTITDEIVLIGNRYYVKATATVQKGGDTRFGVGYAREDDSKKGMDGSQVTGASSSYARKYALNGLFLIDDTKDADTETAAKALSTTASKAAAKPVHLQRRDRTCRRAGDARLQLIRRTDGRVEQIQHAQPAVLPQRRHSRKGVHHEEQPAQTA